MKNLQNMDYKRISIALLLIAFGIFTLIRGITVGGTDVGSIMFATMSTPIYVQYAFGAVMIVIGVYLLIPKKKDKE